MGVTRHGRGGTVFQSPRRVFSGAPRDSRVVLWGGCDSSVVSDPFFGALVVHGHLALRARGETRVSDEVSGLPGSRGGTTNPIILADRRSRRFSCGELSEKAA